MSKHSRRIRDWWQDVASGCTRGAEPLLVFVIALLVTGLLVINIAETIARQDRSTFDNEATRALDAMNQRVHTISTLLRGVSGLFAASDEVDRGEFSAYVSSLQLRDRYPGILGVGYIHRVPAGSIAAYEAHVREELPGFEIWPDHARDEHYAIQFLEPMDVRNRAAIGFDMFTDVVRQEAMLKAAARNDIVASGKVTLIQEIDEHKQSGFLLFMPVYDRPLLKAVPRERQLRGFVYSPLRAGDLLTSVRGTGIALIDLEVFDGTEPAPSALLRSTLPADNAGYTPKFSSEHVIEVGGRPWLVRFHSRPEKYQLSQAWLLPWLVITALASSLLLAWLSWSQLRARHAAEQAARTQRESAQALHAERERLSATLASIGEGVVAVDASDHIVLMNPVAERLTGWRAVVARGRPLHEVVQVNTSAGDGDGSGVASIGTQGSGEAMLQARDGCIRPVDHISAPILNQSGGIAGAVIVMRDATERNRVEAELRNNDRRKDQFLAMLAHELRNPLAPICSSLELLRRTPEPAVAARALAVAERQARLMVRLVNDLLDLSRISRGTISLQREPVAVADVLETAIETSRPLIESRTHHLNAGPFDPALRIHGDPARLAQVFTNLLNNAATYTEPGGHIDVVMQRDGGEVEICVRDDGIGIEAASLPNVFDMFMQVGRSLERSGGLGIGLTVVQRLLQLHGGSIEARSAGLGHGAEFVVRLPLIDSGQSGHAASSAAGAIRRDPLRILVVDDNRDAADSLAMMLGLDGHSVTVAYDGHTALQTAERQAPDVVLLDIGLPGMNGYEVARHLRDTRGAGVTLIAITGWGQDSDRRRAAKAGFDRHMVKPIDYPALVAMLPRSASVTPPD